MLHDVREGAAPTTVSGASRLAPEESFVISSGRIPMALTLTPNGVTCCSHGREPPWLKRQLYKSPERVICVSMLGIYIVHPDSQGFRPIFTWLP